MTRSRGGGGCGLQRRQGSRALGGWGGGTSGQVWYWQNLLVYTASNFCFFVDEFSITGVKLLHVFKRLTSGFIF
jgi:hypothetical protein